MEKYIIDVSKHQGTIEWEKVAPNIRFCILKASGKIKDSMFDRNASECERLQIPYHAYHYIYSVSESAAFKEAELFSNSVGNRKPLFWVLDMEYDGIADKKARAIAEAFESGLRVLRGSNIRIALYIAHKHYKNWNLDYGKYEYVWIPRYKKNDDGQPTGTKPNFYCDLWQYSEKGKIPGINGYVDLNTLSGNKSIAYFIDGHETSPFTKEEAQLGRKTLLGQRTLKKGCKGDDVRELQNELIKMGFSVGKWGADGDFGGSTKSAVMDFQKKYSLAADGVFGPRSFSKWLEVI